MFEFFKRIVMFELLDVAPVEVILNEYLMMMMMMMMMIVCWSYLARFESKSNVFCVQVVPVLAGFDVCELLFATQTKQRPN